MPYSVFMDHKCCVIHTDEGTLIVGDIINVEDDRYEIKTNIDIITIHGYFPEPTLKVFTLHNESGPALICKPFDDSLINTYRFFIHGEIVSMNALGNDDPTLKLLIELKWGHLKKSSMFEQLHY